MEQLVETQPKNWLRSFILGALIVLCAIPREYVLASFADSANRQYGSYVSVTLTMLCIAAFMLTGNLYFRKKYLKAPLVVYLIFSIISGIFLPVNSGNLIYYAVAVIRYVVYMVLFFILCQNISRRDYERAIDIGFKIALFLQLIIGCLAVFFDMYIPYISSQTANRRNGILRMVGTFAHPGDCSLYLSIIMMYYLCKVLFKHDKKSLPFLLLSYFGIYLTQSRTMMIISLILAAFILFRRYRKYAIVKLVFFFGIFAAAFWFFRSDIFYELFIRNSFADMIIARLVHWIMGVRIMFSSIGNFIFGVGLNNIVDYVRSHYSEFSSLVGMSTILSEDFVRGMPIHNSFFIVGCELGIVGFILYIRMYVSYIRNSIKKIKLDKDKLFEYMFVISSLVSIAIYCLQGWAAHKEFSWVMIVVITAYFYVLTNDDKSTDTAKKENE